MALADVQSNTIHLVIALAACWVAGLAFTRFIAPGLEGGIVAAMASPIGLGLAGLEIGLCDWLGAQWSPQLFIAGLLVLAIFMLALDVSRCGWAGFLSGLRLPVSGRVHFSLGV